MESPANLHMFNTPPKTKKNWQVTKKKSPREDGIRADKQANNQSCVRSLFLIFPPFLWSQKINCASSLLLIFCMRRGPCELAKSRLSATGASRG